MRLVEMPNVSIYGDGLGHHARRARRREDPLLPQLTEARVTADGMT
jgi:hypothetical protein